MTVNPDERPTASEILQHKWIQQHISYSVLRDQVLEALTRMSSFTPITCKLRQTVINFIVHQLINKADKKLQCLIFGALNNSLDGVLSLEGMIQSFETNFGQADEDTREMLTKAFERAKLVVDGKEVITYG